ncbi:MAG: endolytic transglycosylase MltG [Myxococcales bacterium]|nr:endolytic transglycosylase MltG [Myxococcales bacterium]
MRIAILIVSTLVLAALGIYLVVVDHLERNLLEGVPGPVVERVVTVAPGTSVATLLGELEEQGLLRDGGWMDLYAERLRTPTVLVPGEYSLNSGMSPLSQLGRVAGGEVLKYTVVLPGGGSLEDAVRVLAAERLVDAQVVSGMVRDPKVVEALGLSATSLEGFMFPDAYTLPRGMSPQDVLEVVVERFRAFMDKNGPSERPEYEVLRVASLVEQGPVRMRERRIYAALLYNRLAKKIPLEHPTAAAYGTRLGFDPKENPYRTDRPGLPPTPICSPGPDALKAALHPVSTDVLYLVRQEDGSHVYCPDLECFRAAKRAKEGLPPTLPPPPPLPEPVLLQPEERPAPEPLVEPGKPLTPQPPSDLEEEESL